MSDDLYGVDADDKEAMKLRPHLPHPARSPGTSMPGKGKSETPTKPLKPEDDVEE
jgi:hypothetical protein